MPFAYECGVLRQSKGYTHWFTNMSYFLLYTFVPCSSRSGSN